MACGAPWSGTKAKASRSEPKRSDWTVRLVIPPDDSPLRRLFPINQLVQVIAERAIGAEGFLVEQPLGAAA